MGVKNLLQFMRSTFPQAFHLHVPGKPQYFDEGKKKEKDEMNLQSSLLPPFHSIQI